MADKKTRHVFDNLSGGRNGYLPAWAIGETECADAVNVDFYKSRFGNKRGGMTPLATASFFAAGIVSWLYRHVPGTDETAAELWAIGEGSPPDFGVMRAGTTFASPIFAGTPIGTFTGNAWELSAASINSKILITYKSANLRPVVGEAGILRKAGLVAPAAPTAANGAVAGAYPAVLRYYRQRWTTQSGGVTIRRSEPSTSVSFTPSGAFTTAVVTRSAVPASDESETHWELEASTDNVSFYRIATVVVATTTYADSALVATYRTNPLSALTGTYTLQKCYKFVAADQNRVLGFGSHTTTDKQHRIEYSAVIGSLDISDEERVDTTVGYYTDIDEMDSGEPTGLCGPIYGSFFAFKERQVWQGTPTGNVDKPYDWRAITKTTGAIAFNAIAKGEDALGNPALYWMSRRGPYRWGIFGVEYLGRNLEDYVVGPTAVLNLAATKAKAVVMFYQDKRQVWYWWPTGSSNDPNQGFIYDLTTGGWSRIPSGDLWANVRCAVMFANTPAASMSKDLKPYVGQTGANDRIWKADTGTTDNGTTYQGYVITKAVEPGGPGFVGEAGEAVLLAKVASGVTITDTVTGDFGLTTATGTALLTAVGSETRVSVPLTGSALGQVQFVQHQIGDASASDVTWTLDRLICPVGPHQSVSG